MNIRNRKNLACMICMTYIFVTFFSLFFIAKEENHHCTGEDCPICASVHQAEQTLKNLGTGTMVVSETGITVICYELAFAGLCLLGSCTSLITQKVRLND